MSVLEARQNPDGTLAFGFADELVDSFWDDVPVSLTDGLPTRLDAPDGYTAVVSDEELPGQFYAKAVLDIGPGTTECGLLLRSSQDGDHSYVLRLEPKRGRLVFDRWPRAITGDAQWHVSGDVPFDVELERPCNLAPGDHTLEVDRRRRPVRRRRGPSGGAQHPDLRPARGTDRRSSPAKDPPPSPNFEIRKRTDN